ncbi:hypothetical protein WG915_00425 [Corynebacterium sp. H128]|uniref:Rv2732c family membrane protein n=1 Tax=Corynebacterium sp. H128 TaxID=3133427 RepID=UPI0030B1240B
MSDSAENSAQELAEQERQAARRLDMSGYRVPLFAGSLIIVVSWFLPYTGNITGLDIALFSQRSVDYGIAVPERAFVLLCALGPVALTWAAYFLKSTRIAQVAWFFSGISMFYSIFAIWMRQTRDQGYGPGPGLIVAALAVLLVVYGLYNVVTLVSDEQEEIAAQRRKQVELDPVAKVQLSKMAENKNATGAPIDDRRARSAERRAGAAGQDQQPTD